jgi:RNA polymerase sigma factor (sigma-70 family)
MRGWSDDEIWRGLRDPARSQRAFWELHTRYGPRLLGFLARMCHGDRDQAEDLLGRTLYKAYHGLLQMEEPCRKLTSWLFTVAARTALDEFQKSANDPLRSSLPLSEEIVSEGTPPEAGDPADAAVDDAVEAVLARLDRENPRYRTLLEMEHVGVCDRGEIAEATGIARKQLAQYLKRAKQRFCQIAREYPVLAALEAGAEAEGVGQ